MIDSSNIEILDEMIRKIGSDAKIPVAPSHGFDGDSWRWIWRQKNRNDQYLELHLRVDEDVVAKRIRVNVQGVAWEPSDRQSAQPLGTDEVENAGMYLDYYLKGHEAGERLINVLAPSLSRKWREVEEIAGLLEQYKIRYTVAESQLRSRIEDEERGRHESDRMTD